MIRAAITPYGSFLVDPINKRIFWEGRHDSRKEGWLASSNFFKNLVRDWLRKSFGQETYGGEC